MKIKEGHLCFMAGDRIEVESKGFETMSEALREESRIKKLKREKKLELINGNF